MRFGKAPDEFVRARPSLFLDDKSSPQQKFLRPFLVEIDPELAPKKAPLLGQEVTLNQLPDL